jgi:hypothetical protein
MSATRPSKAVPCVVAVGEGPGEAVAETFEVGARLGVVAEVGTGVPTDVEEGLGLALGAAVEQATASTAINMPRDSRLARGMNVRLCARSRLLLP